MPALENTNSVDRTSRVSCIIALQVADDAATREQRRSVFRGSTQDEISAKRKAQGEPRACSPLTEKPLFCFAINHMPAQDRIVLAKLQPIRIVAAILGREIHVGTLGALQLDNLARSLFCHRKTPSISCLSTNWQYSADVRLAQNGRTAKCEAKVQSVHTAAAIPGIEAPAAVSLAAGACRL